MKSYWHNDTDGGAFGKLCALYKMHAMPAMAKAWWDSIVEQCPSVTEQQVYAAIKGVVQARAQKDKNYGTPGIDDINKWIGIIRKRSTPIPTADPATDTTREAPLLAMPSDARAHRWTEHILRRVGGKMSPEDAEAERIELCEEAGVDPFHGTAVETPPPNRRNLLREFEKAIELSKAIAAQTIATGQAGEGE